MMEMNLPIIGPGFSPDRVIVDCEGLGVPSRRAREQYGINPDIIFLRNDGWTLGAPGRFEAVAYRTWKGYWTHFVRKPETTWKPISEYQPRNPDVG